MEALSLNAPVVNTPKGRILVNSTVQSHGRIERVLLARLPVAKTLEGEKTQGRHGLTRLYVGKATDFHGGKPGRRVRWFANSSKPSLVTNAMQVGRHRKVMAMPWKGNPSKRESPRVLPV